MSHGEVYRNTLTYALAIAGSERGLAARLNIPMPRLINYLYGIEPIPNEVFLMAVDVVLNSTRQDIEHSRELLNKLRANRSRPKGTKAD